MTFHTQPNLELYWSPDEISPDGDIYIKQGTQQHKGNFAITGLHSGKRIAVVPDLEMAKQIASMASSYNVGGYGCVVIESTTDKVTHTDAMTWLDR